MKTESIIPQKISTEHESKNHSPQLQEKIAELAYFKAEQRGFQPGHEEEDWLIAEREIVINECSNTYANPKKIIDLKF
jgi:hypothetical protein